MSANAFIGTLKTLGVQLSHADGERLLIGLKITDTSHNLTTGRRAIVNYSDFLKFIAKHTSLIKKGAAGDEHASSLQAGATEGDGDGARVLRNALRNLLQRHSMTNGILEPYIMMCCSKCFILSLLCPLSYLPLLLLPSLSSRRNTKQRLCILYYPHTTYPNTYQTIALCH